VRGHLRQQMVVQRALARTQFHVGFAVDRAYRAGELGQGGCVDQVHGKRQRHAQHDGHHGRGVAPGVVPQFLPGEGAQQRAHGLAA
jgi:hypothetical protein